MRKLVCFMNNRWVKYLMAGSVTVLMVLVIIFIIRSVKENSLVVSCPDTLSMEVLMMKRILMKLLRRMCLERKIIRQI